MLKLININRKLGNFALTDINFELSEGQYYVLLGRSGAGKTQLLELIAGLEYADSGSIYLDGEDITTRKIQERKVGIVFQDYAVFPHMTVFGNIAYPLKAKKITKETIREKVLQAALEMHIAHILDRHTGKLSGGEMQRVALARTLVTSPRLLLLDEPLASLDASLKDDMKKLLRCLNKSGQTIIHVTHDYGDALSLAKRVGVIHNGRIIQEGSVDEVFSRPANKFVARYAGIRNFFRINISNSNGDWTGLSSNNLKFRLDRKNYPESGLMILKSDVIKLSREIPELPESLNIFKGRVEEIIPSEYGVEVSLDAGDLFYAKITSSEFAKLHICEGDELWISFPAKATIVLQGAHDIV